MTHDDAPDLPVNLALVTLRNWGGVVESYDVHRLLPRPARRVASCTTRDAALAAARLLGDDHGRA